MDSTAYYDKNAQEFHDRTINADMQDLYQKFLSYLPKKGRILDAGCGVGRDSRYFLSRGYQVLPFDASAEMVRMTSDLLGQETLHMRFEEIDFINEFDAIWASASLLHLPYEKLREVLQAFHPLSILQGSSTLLLNMEQRCGRWKIASFLT